jgi:nicotinate-nucleotide adenylyltransferase
MTSSSSEGQRRLGIFGGTFDPLHMGHLAVAQDVLETLELDRVLFVPAGIPPHKPGEDMTPGSFRLRMIRAAIEDDPRFEALELELRREGPSWTVDTVRELRERWSDAELFLIMGTDQWAGFGGWREPREIARLANLVVMSREGENPRALDPGFTDGEAPAFTEVPVVRFDVSSSGIRRRIREGRSVRYLVPEPVLGIIKAGKMYL